jgi:hypothetical protein
MGKGMIEFRAFDIKTAFNRTSRKAVLQELQVHQGTEEWSTYINHFLKPKQFEVWWEGELRGRGSMNGGTLQGSPLSPVIFAISLEPTLRRIEHELNRFQINYWLSAFVDDLGLLTKDSEDMENAREIVKEIMEEDNYPLNESKEESITFNGKGNCCEIET